MDSFRLDNEDIVLDYTGPFNLDFSIKSNIIKALTSWSRVLISSFYFIHSILFGKISWYESMNVQSMGMAVMLEEIINYVHSLQNQVEVISYDRIWY
jgi:hypothetical protein